MMIRSILFANNFVSYKSFVWNPSSIKNFKKFNLFYGWNYSGKTTLSRMFAVMGGASKPDGIQGNFKISIQNGETPPVEWDPTPTINPLQIKVFNRDFIKNNFVKDHNAPAVHILGEGVNHLREKIKKRQKQIERVNLKIDKISQNKSAHQGRLDNEKTSTARIINGVLGGRYDRRNLDQTFPLVRNNPDDYLLTEENLTALKRTLATAADFTKIEISKSQIPDINSILTKTHDLLTQTASNQAIIELKKDPVLENWLRTALELHKSSTTCKFCGSIVPVNITERLQGYFNTEQERLRSDIINYLGTIPESLYFHLPDESKVYPHLRDAFLRETIQITIWKNHYESTLKNIKDALNQKLNNNLDQTMDGSFEFPEVSVWDSAWENLSKIIQTQNEQTQDTQSLISDSRRNIEYHYIAVLYNSYDINDHAEKQSLFDLRTQKYSHLTKACTEQISTIEIDIQRQSVAVHKLNQILRLLLPEGHIEVFPVSESTFEFRRNRIAATNLSDGEQTAVTFAYFLTSLEDRDQKLEDTIVFIDDPISSLDSNHVYSVWALINEHLKKAKQLFISTHNNELFTLIKDEWTDNRDSNQKFKDKHAGYWVTRFIDADGQQSKFENLPDMLRKHKSEYQFIFSLLKRFTDLPIPTYHEAYTSPNLLRKFLEAYLGFRKPDGRSWEYKLNLLFDDPVKRKEVYKFSNDASHLQKPARVHEHPSYIEIAQSLCREVMHKLEENDEIHYKGLVEQLV